MISRIFWTCLGVACAAWIEITLVPHSQNPLLLHIVAGLVVLGGVARGIKK